MEKYSPELKEFFVEAQSLASKLNHQRLLPEHLLLVMSHNLSIQKILNKSGCDLEILSKLLADNFEVIPKVIQESNNLYIDKQTKGLMQNIEKMAASLSNNSMITPEFMILEMAKNSELNVGKILKKSGVDKMNLGKNINEAHNNNKNLASENIALNKYARDLTREALEGRLDPVIGRDEEIRRAIQVLARRTKNNPILIGEPGVGKTAIVEGLALRIVNKDVPEVLLNKKIMALDIGLLVAGAKFRGEFEERVKMVLKEVIDSNDSIIIFIDEIHTIVGAGASEGSMDASNLLKPQLARGQLHCIGATTLKEHTKYIEKDAALARRFQTILVKEPTIEDSISILRGLKEKYEIHHGLSISDKAIVSACELSKRYITDRFLPDKAIDLIDEASSKLKMEIDTKPADLDEAERKLTQYKIEIEAIDEENDTSSDASIKSLKEEVKKLTKTRNNLEKKWTYEKKKLSDSNTLKEKLDNFKSELIIVKRKGDLTRAGELTYQIIPNLENELIELEKDTANKTFFPSVDREDIANVVSKWTGIPINKMLEEDRSKILSMENFLNNRVIGQDNAIKLISNAVRRSRAGLNDPTKPIASFIFVGPTGVGKTELTKVLADFLFDDEKAMARIDMSEYMEKHSVARLIGSPPGYVGYDEGGVLTESIRRRPYQVILFDEIEKAHKDVFNLFLQILDDGRLTDGQGRTINFSNTIIIMTSNIGTNYFDKCFEENLVEREKMILNDIKTNFKPEFINRIDDIVIFNQLDIANVKKIVELELIKLDEDLSEKGIALMYDDSVLNYLASHGYDKNYGARPIKRLVQSVIKDNIALKIISNEYKVKNKIQILVDNEKLVIN